MGPTGLAPTQELGEAIAAPGSKAEGFLAISAKLPTFRTLVLLPQTMLTSSFARYRYDDPSGTTQTYEVRGGL